MSQLNGHFSDGRSAALQPAILSLGDDGRLDLQVGELRQTWLLPQLRITARLGNTPRRITTPDGGHFETRDNDALDRWLAGQRRGREQHWVHRLEQRWHWAIAALLLCVCLIGGGVWWGIPWSAKRIALALPPEVNAVIAQGTLEVLDRTFFDVSELPEPRREALRERFAPLAADHPELNLTLNFRGDGRVGPNAFALPDGQIVVTDALVELAEVDEEILAVLAHEIGHVKQRHGLRMVLQSSGVAALVAGLLGDLGSITAVASGLPTALVHASYSRDFEREADAFAVQMMRRHDLTLAHMASILRKLGEVAGEDHSFFASHPHTSERIKLTKSLE